MPEHHGSNKKKLLIGGIVVVIIIIICVILYILSDSCKSDEEMIDGKCVIKCATDQSRVAGVCTGTKDNTVDISGHKCQPGMSLHESHCVYMQTVIHNETEAIKSLEKRPVILDTIKVVGKVFRVDLEITAMAQDADICLRNWGHVNLLIIGLDGISNVMYKYNSWNRKYETRKVTTLLSKHINVIPGDKIAVAITSSDTSKTSCDGLIKDIKMTIYIQPK
jgi:hypothetical protein